MLKRHLAEAEEHIATGDKNIARQRDVIAQLERDGRDTASARTFLHEFEQLQAQHILISLAYIEEDGLLLSVGFLAAIILIGLGSAAVWGAIVGAVLISAE